MTAEADPLAVGGIIGGAIAVVTALGQGVRWLFARADKRESDLDSKEAALIVKLEKRVDALEQDTRRLWMVVGLVVPALHRHDPLDPSLRVASKLLGDMFPIDPSIPPDMVEILKNMK